MASKWQAVLGVVVAVAAAGFARVVVGDYLWPMFQRMSVTEASAEAMLTQSQPETYAYLKAHFPDDYAALIHDLTEAIRNGGNTDAAARLGAERVAALRRKLSTYITSGNEDDLSRLTALTADLHDRVLREQGFATCNRVALEGPIAIIGTPAAETLTGIFGDIALAFFQLVDDAKQHPVPHQPPTDDDWVKVGDAMIAAGATDAQMAALASQDASSPDLCAAVVLMMRTIAAMHNTPGDAVMAEMLHQSAAG